MLLLRNQRKEQLEGPGVLCAVGLLFVLSRDSQQGIRFVVNSSEKQNPLFHSPSDRLVPAVAGGQMFAPQVSQLCDTGVMWGGVMCGCHFGILQHLSITTQTDSVGKLLTFGKRLFEFPWYFFSYLLASWYEVKGCFIEFFPLALPNLNVSFLMTLCRTSRGRLSSSLYCGGCANMCIVGSKSLYVPI